MNPDIIGIIIFIGLAVIPTSIILLTGLISVTEIAAWIGLATIVTLLSIGMWRIAVEGTSQIYCKDCCNPDHWSADFEMILNH